MKVTLVHTNINVFDLEKSLEFYKKALKMEEVVFISIIILPILAIFTGLSYFIWGASELVQNIYLTAMSALVGMKVAFGFFVLFYRYIAIERLSDEEE